MCFLELLKKIDNWIVTSASILDECRLITMDQVRIVWIIIQNDKWAKVIFHSCNTIVPNAFNYLNRPRRKFVRLISKKSCVFHHSMAYCASNTILSICIYTIYVSNLLSENSKKSPFNFQLPFEIPFFYSVLSMQPYKWDFVYENSFSITILRHAKFLSAIYYSRTVFFLL